MGRKKHKIIIGVYMIKCIANGKVYIGQTKNMKQRWKNHKKGALNKRLLPDVMEYGWEGFEFVVLEECETVSQAKIKEMHYMNLYESFKEENGYNVTVDY